MDVEERIERMLINYLAKEQGIAAHAAWFGDTEGPYDDGCPTCGYNSTGMTFEIAYRLTIDNSLRVLNLDGDPLNFFPTLLKYDED